MTRLFLSLYLFIVVTLVVLSALLNQVFFNQEFADNSKEISTQIIDIAELAWSENELQSLANGDTLSLYDPTLGTQTYTLLNDKQLLEITFAEK